MSGTSTGFGTSQKNDPAIIPPPGPPFDPTSADNGLSVDGAGVIVLFGAAGSPAGTGPARLLNQRELDLNGNQLSIGLADATGTGSVGITADQLSLVQTPEAGTPLPMLNIVVPWNTASTVQGAIQLNVDNIASNPVSRMLQMNDTNINNEIFGFAINGDFELGNHLTQGSEVFDVIESAIDWFQVNGPTKVISIGDFTGQSQGTTLLIDDNVQDIIAENFITNGRVMHLDTSGYGADLGDISQIINGTQLNIFPIGSFIVAKVNNLTTMQLTEVHAILGDVNSAQNGTQFIVDDQNQLMTAVSANALVVQSTDGIVLRHGGTLSNAAAAALGTITNAPVAGNPTKWITIMEGATPRRIPSW